ncbi:hypothetical protein NH340_JMT01950 [Sarcoptes scabiei]|nr:hypothetical protein NH340_JMT01950 [Sarcoptes scabiei]
MISGRLLIKLHLDNSMKFSYKRFNISRLISGESIADSIANSVEKIGNDAVSNKREDRDGLRKHSTHSSLYVSSKYGQEIFRVLEPLFDFKYLKSIANDLDSVRELFERRSIKNRFFFDNLENDGHRPINADMLNEFADCLRQIEKLRKKRSKLFSLFKMMKKAETIPNDWEELFRNRTEQNKNELNHYRIKLHRLEEIMIPFLLSVPNRISPSITDHCQCLRQFKSESFKDSSIKTHGYVRLGYINNLFHNSIVGPNAIYVHGNGALIYYALIDIMSERLDQLQYFLLDGMDFVKCALVEAVNQKEFRTDPFLLNYMTNDNEDNQRFHFVGDSSLESICSFLVKNDHLDYGKFYQTGSSMDSIDFEPNHHCIRVTSLNKPEESAQVIENLSGFICDLLEQLRLQYQLIQSDLTSLANNEYDKRIILIYLPSKNHWIELSQLCDYHHYISQRLGLSNYSQKHLISMKIDLITLIYAIVEQHQNFKTGLINYPNELSKYLNWSV